MAKENRIMDVQVANELVAMRHEAMAHSRRTAGGSGGVRNTVLRAAMWAFGAAVVAPRGRRDGRGGRRAARVRSAA